MNSKQTAVEWLIDEIEEHYILNNGILDPTVVMELKRQAKAMEKEQKKCYHPLSERKYTSDYYFECTICGDNNY
jgi:hypothetical protein